MARLSVAEYRKLRPSPKRRKYGNTKTVIDGHTFDSKHEAKRYAILKRREKAGEITGLLLQPRYPISINSIMVCTVVPDFRYFDKTLEREIVEDAKSPITRKNRAYRLKNKLLKAVFDIDLIEV